LVDGYLVDEGLVDLDDDDGEGAEATEGGVASAVVIEGETNAEVLRVSRRFSPASKSPISALSVISRINRSAGSPES